MSQPVTGPASSTSVPGTAAPSFVNTCVIPTFLPMIPLTIRILLALGSRLSAFGSRL